MTTHSELQGLYPWLNKDLFYKILSKEYHKNNVEIKHVTLKAALAKGENYTSQMIRATVEYSLDQIENNKINFVIKAAIMNELYAQFYKEMTLFEKEVTAYVKILPRVYELLNGIGDDTKLAPRCYEASIEKTYIVFEDLKDAYFENTDKKHGLNFEDFKFIFTKLAKWHAATAVVETMDNSLMDVYHIHFAHEANSVFKTFVFNSFTMLLQTSKLWPDFEQISKKLENSSPEKFSQKILDSISLNKNEFNVLNHGDLWVNNIMFSHNEKRERNDCVFVDFQVGYWGSPVLDILNNYFNSFHKDLCETELNILVQHYYDVLESTLRKLKYSKPIPTLADIQAQIINRGIYSCSFAIIALGARHLETDELTDVSIFTGPTEEDEKYRLKMVSKPECRKVMKFLLKYFDRMGYFD